MNSKSVVVSKCVAVLFLFTAQLIGVFGASDDIFDYNNPSRYGLDYLTRFPVLPQMTSPELNPLDGLHLPYLHPVTMFVEENKDTLPYDYVRVHYKICIYNHTECTDDSMIDRQLRSILPGETIGLRLDNVDDEGIGRNTLQMERPIKVTIASFASSGISWRREGNVVPGYNHSKHPTDSPTTITTYYLEDDIYGTTFVAPYYSGEYSGVMPEVDLMTTKYNTLRIHGLYNDFADFYSEQGTSPYVKATSTNSEDQVHITNLAEIDDSLKGFQNCFSALSGNVSYVFLSPYFNGVEYHGKIVRLTAGIFNTTGDMEDKWASEFRDMTGTEGIDVLDLTKLNETIFPDTDGLRGFISGFSYGDHAYFVPFFNGRAYSSKLVRVHVDHFDADHVEVLDLEDATHIPEAKGLKGYYGGFAPSFNTSGVSGITANYGYLVPYKNMKGPVGGVNTQKTSDGFADNLIFDEQESYGGDHLRTNYHGRLVRVNLDTFNASDVEVIDLQNIDPDLKGFASGFVGGRHGYLVPYSHGMRKFFGKVVRFDLFDFSLEKVEVLDLTGVNSELRGFLGGFSFDHYAFFVPYQNGRSDVNDRGRSQFSKVVRVDLNDFSPNSVIYVDVSTAYRKNLPDTPDASLRGFNQGFVAGRFLYLIPHFNGIWFGKICRVDLYDFELYADLQLRGESTKLETGYKGVQELDLSRFSDDLKGFSGATLRLRPPPGKRWVAESEEKAFGYQEFNINFLMGNSAKSVDVGVDGDGDGDGESDEKIGKPTKQMTALKEGEGEEEEVGGAGDKGRRRKYRI